MLLPLSYFIFFIVDLCYMVKMDSLAYERKQVIYFDAEFRP